MAALNQQETEALREVMGVLEGVIRNGFDPNDESQRLHGAHIKRAKDKLHTVIQMKGHYPK